MHVGIWEPQTQALARLKSKVFNIDFPALGKELLFDLWFLMGLARILALMQIYKISPVPA